MTQAVSNFYHPTLDQVRELAQQGNLIPIYREINADLETPVSAFLKTARGPYSFLLESVEGGERWARYSFIGTEPYKVQKNWGKGDRPDPLAEIAAEMGKYQLVPIPELPRFHGGAVGYLAWEAARHYEKLPSPETDPLGLPEAVFLYADTVLAFDHLKHKIKVISHAHIQGDVEKAYLEAVGKIERVLSRLSAPLPPKLPPPFGAVPQGEAKVMSNMDRERYGWMISKGKEYIYAGDVIQVVLAQRFQRPLSAHPFDVYRALRTVNPSPYMYYLHLDDFYIVGASPELLVRVENGQIDYHPIAGTRPRGSTPEMDDALEEELRHDEKERAEHVMLLDLGRNDVGRVSEPGSVKVTQIMDVERYSHVMHLVSHVQGRLKKGLTSLDALRACFPAGTVSGAPKIRAMEIIAELEPDQRGPYAGTVGYYSFAGNLDTAITLRTLVIKDGMAYVQAGGGIVADSVVEQEFRETQNKAQASLKAIEEAESARGGGSQ